MAKKEKREKKDSVKIPAKYTVQVVKEDKWVDGTFAIIANALGIYFIYTAARDFAAVPAAGIFRFLVALVFLFVGILYYPRYVLEHIDVEGDMVTFHRLYFRKYKVNFKQITDCYADGKQKPKNSYFKGSGSHAVIFEFPGGNYRLPCDFCDEWEILKADLKAHGVAVRR